MRENEASEGGGGLEKGAADSHPSVGQAVPDGMFGGPCTSDRRQSISITHNRNSRGGGYDLGIAANANGRFGAEASDVFMTSILRLQSIASLR